IRLTRRWSPHGCRPSGTRRWRACCYWSRLPSTVTCRCVPKRSCESKEHVVTTLEATVLPELLEEPRTLQSSLRSAVRWESGLVVLFIVSLVYGWAVTPYFLNLETFFFAGLNFGEIDLSVASMLGLSASTLGYLFMHGWNIWIAMGICLLVGVLGGALNGVLVTRLGLPSIAVTIGTLTL